MTFLDPFLANRNTESNRDEQASPSFSQGANKESNYITFAGPHVNPHGSFKKFLISNSAQRQLEAYNLANKIIQETKYMSDQKDIIDPPNSESSNRNLNSDSSVPSMYTITFGAKGNEKIVQSLQKGSKNSSTKQSPEKTSDFKRISPTKKVNSPSKRDRSSSSPFKKLEGTQSARQSIAKKHTKRDGSWEVSVKGVYDVEMKKDLSKGDLMTLPFYAPDVSNVTTSEIFLNISTLTANNDKKMLLNKSFEMNSSRSNSVHLGINNGEVVETQAQEAEEKIVATPVPYIRKKNKESLNKVSGEVLSVQTSHREYKEENEFQNFNSFQEIKNKIRDRVMSEKRNQSLSAEGSLVSSARKARDAQNDNLISFEKVEKQPEQDGNILQENTENLVQAEVRKLSFSIDNPLPEKLTESPERIQVDPCPSKRDDLTPERLEEEEGLDDGFTDQLARLGSQKYRDQLQESMNKINIRTIMVNLFY